MIQKAVCALVFSLIAASTSHAVTCDALKLEIEQKVRLAGVQSFSLVVISAGEAVTGQVVGSCDNASKRIVYSQRAQPARFRPSNMVTECKQGFTGTNCEQRVSPTPGASASR